MIVSAAANYSQDSYGNSPKVTDFNGTKCYLEFIETSGILYIAFRGSADIDDALSDLDEKLIDQKGNKKAFIYFVLYLYIKILILLISLIGLEGKFHKGFLERARKSVVEVRKNLIETYIKHGSKLKKLILTGHSLGAAIGT